MTVLPVPRRPVRKMGSREFNQKTHEPSVPLMKVPFSSQTAAGRPMC